MTPADTLIARWWSFVRDAVASPIALWCAFVLSHLWLGMLNLYADSHALGDVTLVYRFWAEQALTTHYWVGIDSSWVYPIVAIVPMLAAAAFGTALYASTWLSMVMLLNAVALAAITGWGGRTRNIRVGWWWVGFLLALGPIAVGRIDSVTVAVAIVGILLIAARPRAGAILLTVAAWIKVWPAALVGAIVIAARTRWRVLAAAIVTSVVIIAAAVALGSGTNVFSFVSQQTNRGLQIEAPVSTVWLWQAFAGLQATYLYYDQNLLTFQVAGDGVRLVGTLMTPLLALVCLAIVLIAVLAVRRGAGAAELLPPLTLALVSALIAFNKVGSPQFMTWLAVPVILGLVTNATGHGRSFRTPGILVAVLAALTQSFYPYLYGWLLALNPITLVLLTARNALIFVLLAWAVVALWQTAGIRDHHELPADETGCMPAVWPFRPVRDTVEETEPMN